MDVFELIPQRDLIALLASDLEFLRDVKFWSELNQVKQKKQKQIEIDFKFDFHSLFSSKLDLTASDESERILEENVVGRILEDPLSYNSYYQPVQQLIREEYYKNLEKLNEIQDKMIKTLGETSNSTVSEIPFSQRVRRQKHLDVALNYIENLVKKVFSTIDNT